MSGAAFRGPTRSLYRAARLVNTAGYAVQSARTGSGAPLAKRIVRRRCYRYAGQGLYGVLRRGGLGA